MILFYFGVSGPRPSSEALNVIMNKIGITISFVLLAIIVAAIEGSWDSFTIWNLSPLLLSYLVLLFVAPKRQGHWKDIPRQRFCPAAGFCVGATGLTTLGHLAWYFDWGGTSTGSYRAGLMFIFLPAYALGLGIIGLLAGLWFGDPRKDDEKNV